MQPLASLAGSTHQTMCMNNFHPCHEYSLKQYLTFPFHIHVYFHHFHSVSEQPTGWCRYSWRWNQKCAAVRDSFLTAFPGIVHRRHEVVVVVCIPSMFSGHLKSVHQLISTYRKFPPLMALPSWMSFWLTAQQHTTFTHFANTAFSVILRFAANNFVCEMKWRAFALSQS